MQETTIRLTGIEVTARHGVYASEKVTAQSFVIDVECVLARTDSDDLSTTVDYAALSAEIADAVRCDSVDLIETLAERIAALCLAHPPVIRATARVHKPQAEMPVPVADIAVEVTREVAP